MPEVSPESSDQQLVAALNAGQDDAFDILYQRHRDWVMRTAWRFTGNHDDALDVLQETFAYLAHKFPGLVLTAAMTTFLYPAVRNLSIAARRKRQRAAGVDVALDSVPDHRSAANSAHSEVATFLSGLSDDHREVLLLRFVDDLTQPEIAERLGLPVGTVKSRLHHAVRCLRESPAAARLAAAGSPE